MYLAVLLNLVSLAYRGSVFRDTFRFTMQSVATCIVIVFGLLAGNSRVSSFIARLARNRLVRSLGLASYSIYLAHLPVCVVLALGLMELGVTGFWGRTLVVVPVASAAVVAASFGFYRLIESRFLGPPPRPKLIGRSPVRRPAWPVRFAGGRA